MNKGYLLDLLIKDSEKNSEKVYSRYNKKTLEKLLYGLNKQYSLELPSLPEKESKMISVLRKNFNDDIAFISLILNRHFPEKYIFYRPGKTEWELFTALDYFNEVHDLFEFKFKNIGRGKKSFEKYKFFNKAILEFAKLTWNNSKDITKLNNRITYFLYNALPGLFMEKSDYRRYWIMATREDYWGVLDNMETGEIIEWSGRKEMQENDIVFMYRISPRKAITNIFRVTGDIWTEPYEAWDAFGVNLELLGTIDDITFSDMKKDKILSQWGVVKKQFQGTVSDPVPHNIYNRLLEKIPENIKKKYNLKKEEISSAELSGTFYREVDFEENIIEPLLRRMNFTFKYQFPCNIRAGSQKHPCRVDYCVSYNNEPVTLFEDKLRIINEEKELKEATEQGKSYALQLGFPSFVVASPEFLWIYKLNKNKEELVEKIPTEDWEKEHEKIKKVLLELRAKY